MVRPSQLSALILIFCISFGHTTYSPWARWILTDQYLSGGKIKDSMNTAPDLYIRSPGSISSSICKCGYLQTSGIDSFVADFRGFKTQSPTQFGVSIWVYFTSTSNTFPFKLAIDDTGSVSNYNGISPADGEINFSFADNSGNTDSSKDSLLTIDLGKFYIGKWLFVSFYWVQTGSDVTWSILIPSLATVEKTSAGSTVSYIMPVGYFIFGGPMAAAKFYEVQVFKSVTRTTSTDLVITIADANGETYAATTSSCPNSCNSYCYPDYGCLSSTTCQCPLLYNCDATGATISCKDPNADFSNSCQCNAGYHLQGSTCVVGIFHVDCPLNCAECSSSTVCTLCNSLYYLHDISGGGTECVCNFHVACTSSCNSCEPDAACYECAISVVKEQGMCRADSIGFQVSFSSPFVVLDFAHPLKQQLTVGNLVAKTADGTSVSTSDWTIDPSSTLSQLKVKTSLKQSQLPISLNLKFGKVNSN